MNAIRLGGLCLVLLLVGCKSVNGDYPRNQTLIPSAGLKLSENYTLPLEKLVYFAGAAYVVYLVLDPLAPNWEIEEARLDDDTYYLGMRMKRFHTGGDGEARMVFRRRAEQLARAGGYAGYEVMSFSEGVQSDLIAQRVSEGVIQLNRGTR